MQLKDTLTLITGGASGMGRACVELFLQQGARVIIIDHNIPENLFSHEPNVLSLKADVSDAKTMEACFETLITRMGTPRVLIQCAGIAPAKKMVGKSGVMPLADFEHTIKINLLGTFNVMRLMVDHLSRLPALEDSERGVIINTASIAAFEGQIGQVAYSASKAGIVGMTLPAARELAEWGIRVNTIAPGLVATPLLLTMPTPVQESLSLSVPFPKRFAKPQEFAALARHIVENLMINGEVIRLDGALRMQAK